jgi:hypothetical protein
MSPMNCSPACERDFSDEVRVGAIELTNSLSISRPIWPARSRSLIRTRKRSMVPLPLALECATRLDFAEDALLVHVRRFYPDSKPE